MSDGKQDYAEGEMLAIRENPLKWFQGFGRWRNEETRKPTRGPANVLQRRVFEHYRRCQEENRPARMVVLKYRRAGSSTAGSCLMYLHAQNYEARLGVIGTDYRASQNMLEMVKFYGEHDDFPGWSVSVKEGGQTKVSPEDYYGDDLHLVPWEQRTEKILATKLSFSHGSTVELYTSKNPESARSAGLNGYHATEVARWKTGGVQDAGETMTAMRNTLPKRGFHIAVEESTANGAQGLFYETCLGAMWPPYADWAKQWQTSWPLSEVKHAEGLQFVLIFAAWFEDNRHTLSRELTEEEVEDIRSTLDEREKELIALYEQDGPKGRRLGDEVETTTWQQLAWRRGIIATVCTKGGADEFAQEYPANPLEAFRSSGSPALDQEGLGALEIMARQAQPEHGIVKLNNDGRVSWERVPEGQSMITRWEEPIVGCRYLVTVDPMTGAEQITGSSEKDRHAVFVIRDAHQDSHGRYHLAKVVARIRPPCQWESAVLARYVWMLSALYGGANIVVEGNQGLAVIQKLNDEHHAPLYRREVWDNTRQRMTTKLGYWMDEGSRRVAIGNLQEAVREQRIEVLCPHLVGEMKALIVDNKGKVRGGGSNHDDDPLSLAIGLTCLHTATTYREDVVVAPEPSDAGRWKAA